MDIDDREAMLLTIRMNRAKGVHEASSMAKIAKKLIEDYGMTPINLRKELGMDVPKIERYLIWVKGMLIGDFGISYTYRSPVIEMVSERLWVSLPLAIYALILSTFIALPVGIYAAANRGKVSDLSVMGITQIGIAIPNFWFAMLLVYFGGGTP